MNKIAMGYWKSSYVFHDEERNGDYRSEHIVRAYVAGRDVIFESDNVVNESYLIVRVREDGDLATGSYEEHTSTNGYFKGSIMRGACQFIVPEDGKSLHGRWLARVYKDKINSNIWEMTYIGPELPEGTEKIVTEQPAN